MAILRGLFGKVKDGTRANPFGVSAEGHLSAQREKTRPQDEALAKIAIEVCDGLLVHSLLGALKPGDIPASVRTRAIAALADSYFVMGDYRVDSGDSREFGPVEREQLVGRAFARYWPPARVGGVD